MVLHRASGTGGTLAIGVRHRPRWRNQPPAAPRLAYVGVVVENDSVAHALYRMAWPAADTINHVAPSPAPPVSYDAGLVTTLELRPAAGRWYVRFDREFSMPNPFANNVPAREYAR